MIPKRLINAVKKRLLPQVRKDRAGELFQKYEHWTMTPESGFRTTLSLAEEVTVPGDVVECGSWKGGMIAAISEVMTTDRRYHLFDSFEGLPPAKEIDGPAALAWQEDTTGPKYYNNCTASIEEARTAVRLTGNAETQYSIHKGWFEETIPPVAKTIGPIALLRLDGDWYDSIKLCLDQLGDKVASGGMIIIDDYITWDGCTRAVNQYLAQDPRVLKLRENSRVTFIRIP